MYWRDIVQLAHRVPSIQSVLNDGFFAVGKHKDFTHKKFRCLLSFASAYDPRPHISHISRTRVRLNWQQDFSKAVNTNCCPWCLTIFSTVQVAKHHVKTRQIKGACPSSRTWRPYQINWPRNTRCPICQSSFKDNEADLFKHVTSHYIDFGSSDSSTNSSDSSRTVETSDSNSDSSETAEDGEMA